MGFHFNLAFFLFFSVHLVCRWVWEWRRSKGGKQMGGRARDSMELEGGGGITSVRWGGGTKITLRSRFSLLAWHLYGIPSQLFFLYFLFYISIPVFLFFQGLGLLKRVSSLKEEAHQLEEEAQHLEMEGLGKVEVAVAGSEVEGFYRFLRGAIAHPHIFSPTSP